MADEPRPMSQEEIDALFANLGKGEPTPPPAAAADEQAATPEEPVDEPAGDPAPADAAESSVSGAPVEAAASTNEDDALASEGAGLEQDDIDALLGDLNEGGEGAMAAQGGPMSQEGIDALLEQLGDDVTPRSRPATQTVDSAMGQSDIDVLLNDINSGREEGAPADGPMDQAGIDALLGDLNEPAPASAPPADGPLDQDGIDALLAQASAEPSAEPAAAAEAAADAPMDQAGIDALLAAANADASADPDKTLAADFGDPDKTLAADLGGTDAVHEPATEVDAGVATSATSRDDNPAMTQSDIDALLGGLEDGAETGTESVPGVGPPTESLTPSKIERLMQRQVDDGDDDDDESEDAGDTGVIAQDDVDALLAQMNEATVAAEEGDDSLRQVLREREDDIDALLREADQQVERTAADAVQPSMVQQPGAAPSAGTPALLPPASVLSPEEVRGSKVLLVVAVCLLAMCSVTLFLVVASVNRLTDELRSSGQELEEATDDYAANIDIARSYLSDADPDQVQRGILFLNSMREDDDFIEHEDDITLLLARHYRSQGAHAKAWREYHAIVARNESLWSDPDLYLEYADSLLASGRLDQAEEVIYQLLGNQAFYTRSELPDGNRRPAEAVATGRRSVQQAYVLLGKLYNHRLQRSAEVADEVAMTGRP